MGDAGSSEGPRRPPGLRAFAALSEVDPAASPERIDDRADPVPEPPEGAPPVEPAGQPGSTPVLWRLRCSDGRVEPVGGRLLIGRDPRSHGAAERSIVVDDPRASGDHAMVEDDRGMLELTDRHSTNGTKLFSERANEWITITPGVAHPLVAGEMFAVAATTFTVERAD